MTSPDVREEEISESDIERWKQGAKAYWDFYNGLTDAEREEIHQPPNVMARRDIPGEILGVFLGEKAFYFEGWSPELIRKFELVGFRSVVGEMIMDDGSIKLAPMIYDPKLVPIFVEKNKDLFKGFPTDPDELMELLLKDEDTYSQQIGALLGFPHAAISFYVESQKNNSVLQRADDLLGAYWGHLTPAQIQGFRVDPPSRYRLTSALLQDPRNPLNASSDEVPILCDALEKYKNTRIYTVHYYSWVDAKDSVESQKRMEHLQKAFELSGILEPYRNADKYISADVRENIHNLVNPD